MPSLGDRMKRYEQTFHHTLLRRMPVMIRVDGKAFHTFTRGLNKPFDNKFIYAMTNAAILSASNMQGFKAGYIQSDEATFCITDYDNLDTQGWFDYDLSKIVSISASMMTAEFNWLWNMDTLAFFDSRAFNVPPNEVINCFLWRAKDWERNSIQMYARAHFTHGQLHCKSQSDIHEMLHGIGKNWTTDLSDTERNGTFIFNQGGIITGRSDILPTYQAINEAIGYLFEPNIP